MKTLLKETSPVEAYKMFNTTFGYKNMPSKLDDAFIHFTNHSSQLRTICTQTIAVYANQKATENMFDVLVICHIIEKPYLLDIMLCELRDDLENHKQNIIKAKKQKEIMGDIFYNDLNQVYDHAIKKYQTEYNSVQQNIYTVEAIKYLVNNIRTSL